MYFQEGELQFDMDDNRLSWFNVLMIHASAVRYQGQAMIFLGRSGSGKSTINQLLSYCMEPLADESVYLVPSAPNEWRVVNASYGETALSLSQIRQIAQHAPPLTNVFVLHQATRSHIRELPRPEICANLVYGSFEVKGHYTFQSVEQRAHLFSRLAQISRNVSGYSLHFSLAHREVCHLVTEATPVLANCREEPRTTQQQ